MGASAPPPDRQIFLWRNVQGEVVSAPSDGGRSQFFEDIFAGCELELQGGNS